jgi:Protein of unknown function (DUF4242)
MGLFLVELRSPAAANRREVIETAARSVVDRLGGRVVESTFAAELGKLYVIVEGVAPGPLDEAVRAAPELEVDDIAAVRLVGDAPVQGLAAPSHLVEWDLPAGLALGDYLARKAQKTPLYAKVPEVKFLRTYVREDMVKCVCLYDAPDEGAVRRARDAVSAPVDRLSRVTPASGDD